MDDGGTRAERLFAVRAALGEGVRKPLSLRAFAELLTEQAGDGRRYHASQLSGWETGAGVPTVDDFAVIAAVDPERRGPAWLAWGIEPAPAAPLNTNPLHADGTPRVQVTDPATLPELRSADRHRKRGRPADGTSGA